MFSHQTPQIRILAAPYQDQKLGHCSILRPPNDVPRMVGMTTLQGFPLSTYSCILLRVPSISRKLLSLS